jgi:hypothetical protein
MKISILILTGYLVQLGAFSAFAQSQAPHIEWAKSYGGLDEDQALCIEKTSDHGFIIAGQSFSNDGDATGHHNPNSDNTDFWIVKIDSAGILQWERSLGGSDGDVARNIKQTPDGYIIIGSSYSSHGDVTGQHGTGFTDDYWIVKLDLDGKTKWEKSLGGTNRDLGFSIDLTPDGGYIAAGVSQSVNGNVTGHHSDTTTSDYWIVKLDSLGNILWEKSFGGMKDDYCYNIHQTSDHGFIVAGSTSSDDGDVSTNKGNEDIWIIKLDSLGNLLWQKSYGGSNVDVCHSISPVKDNGYIAAGYTASNDRDVTGHQNGMADYWIIRIDSVGKLLWQRTFGGSSNDVAYSVRQTFDDGFIIAGEAESDNGDVSGIHGESDYWIVKLDSTGKLQWQKTLGGSSVDFAFSIVQTSDSGFVVAGSSDSDDGDVTDHHFHEDYWVVKLGYGAPSSVISHSNAKQVHCFPNPFSQQTEIEFGEILHTASELIIYNVLGVEMERLHLGEAASNIIIHRGNLTSGAYIYHRVAGGVLIEQGRMMVE